MLSHRLNRSDISLSRPHIGALVAPTDPYWVQVLEAIHQANQKIGDELIILEPAATIDELYAIPPEMLVDSILAHPLDALISNMVFLPVFQALSDAQLPVICLSESDYQGERFISATSLYRGGSIAGEFIAQRLGGVGQVACVMAGLENTVSVGQSRLSGFRDAVSRFPGINLEVISTYWDYTHAYQTLLSSFNEYPHKLDAIFGVSDSIILAARDAARERKVIDAGAVLVGLNGDPLALAAIAEGELTATIDTSPEELGATAIDLAHRAAVGEPLPPSIEQRYQLITRENVASIAMRKLIAIARIPAQMEGFSRQQEHDRVSQLEISTQIAQEIGSLFDKDQVLHAIGALVQQNYGYEWTRVFRLSEDRQSLSLYGGEASPEASQVPVEQDDLLQQVLQSDQEAFIPDTRTSYRWRGGKAWEAIRARAVLPIRSADRMIGLLDLQSSQPKRQLSLEMVGLKLLASQMGIAIQNADLYLDAVQAREAAERANQLKNRLIANVGHEMRTPLNSILGFSQSIQRQIESAKDIHGERDISLNDIQGDLQHIYQSGEHLMYMINDLLDLSRAEIGALSLYFEQVQIAPLLHELFVNFSSSGIASDQVRWVLDIPVKLPLIRADVVRLRQILSNLLANAQRLTRQGKITLGAEVAPPHVHLWVKDTGPGVSMDLQEKIFEPFSSMMHKRRPDGIGLGLSITRHLVLLHGGIITLESRPGSGSTFHVYLPLPGVALEPLPAPSSDGELLLVITGQADIPEEVAEICARRSLQPVPIQTRDDLANALARGKPVAAAWNLAKLSAAEWEMIQQLSLMKDCSALPAILYGADPAENQLKAGITNIFFKPCNNNVLRDWIAQISPANQAGEAILVVDDDPQARQYYLSLLQSSHPGYRILQAENGRQAVSILASETPIFILLDLNMPEMNGFEVLTWIRSEARTRSIPVILISGRLLEYNDIQRLNYFKTVFLTKDLLSRDEATAFLKNMEVETLTIPQSTNLLVMQALSFLHQNYSAPISRKDIADAVGVSENYLSQIFRQEIRLSPWDYLSRIRIHKAKDLLAHSDDTITQIALMVGYNDPAYFSRVFHKLTGCSPQEYRHAG